jgi:hypothetical protein
MITVVSGFPRSGTSMMMQMVKNGGKAVLTDNIRKPDINNPVGYLEFEDVKRITTDVSWIGKADGKAVKIVAPLVKYLPSEFDYRIIFMERNMREIIVSQEKMLGNNGDGFNFKILKLFESSLSDIKNWFSGKSYIDVIFISYSDVVSDPVKYSGIISDFLNEPMNIYQMAKAVDSSLYRNRF